MSSGPTDDKVQVLKLAGHKGGSSRSDAKRASSAANLQRARLKRWPGRELAAQAAAAAQLGQLAQLAQSAPQVAVAPTRPPDRREACRQEGERNLQAAQLAMEAGNIEEAADQLALHLVNSTVAGLKVEFDPGDLDG